MIRRLSLKEALRVYSLFLRTMTRRYLNLLILFRRLCRKFAFRTFESAVSPDIITSFPSNCGEPVGGGLEGSVTRESVSTGDTPQVAGAQSADKQEALALTVEPLL